jgi:hypothetical protein
VTTSSKSSSQGGREREKKGGIEGLRTKNRKLGGN